MTPARKLFPPTGEETEQIQEPIIEKNDSKAQHLVKLLILALLTYVIIFM
jgi:hypothetical protein